VVDGGGGDGGGGVLIKAFEAHATDHERILRFEHSPVRWLRCFGFMSGDVITTIEKPMRDSRASGEGELRWVPLYILLLPGDSLWSRNGGRCVWLITKLGVVPPRGMTRLY
jgi:hypothetical protein